MTSDQIKKDASHVANDASAAAKDIARDAKATGRATYEEVRDQAVEAAGETARAVRDEAADRAEAAKSTVAGEGHRLAGSLRSAAGRQDNVLATRLLEALAGGVADLSDDLNGRNLGTLWNETEDFARRNPGLFVAGAALAGFALVRFARASAPPPEPAPLPAPRRGGPGLQGTAGQGGSQFAAANGAVS